MYGRRLRVVFSGCEDTAHMLVTVVVRGLCACTREVLGRCTVAVVSAVKCSTRCRRTPALHDDLNAGRQPERSTDP